MKRREDFRWLRAVIGFFSWRLRYGRGGLRDDGEPALPKKCAPGKKIEKEYWIPVSCCYDSVPFHSGQVWLLEDQILAAIFAFCAVQSDSLLRVILKSNR
jgi:hypothetical protein